MGTQYNPNPDGDSTAGWTFDSTTISVTGDGIRIRKPATGIGWARQTITMPAGSGRLTLAGVQITRNSDDPLPEFFIFGRDSQEHTVSMFDGWGGKGVRFTLPPLSTPISASGSAYVMINSSSKFDVTVRGLYVYAYGDSAVPGRTPDLDAGDGAWTFQAHDDSLTVTARWTAAPDEYVDTLEWQASTSSSPQVLDASLTTSHVRTWTYTGAGTVAASLKVSNFSGDSYTVTKTIQVPSGTYQAEYAHETDYLHVETDASPSIGAVIDTYSWDWGDGSPDSSGRYASHDYALPGTYTVTLTIANAMGQTSSRQHPVTVTTVPVVPIDFTVEQQRLQIIATSLTTGAAYSWDFGDGGTASTAQAEHTYATAGTYTVTLDVDGDSITQQITVTESYVPADLAQSLRLEVKQDPGEIVPWNRLDNPSGALGASGWYTPGDSVAQIMAGPQGLALVASGDLAYFPEAASVPVPVTPGRYVGGAFELVAIDSPCYIRAILRVYDADGASVANSGFTAYQDTPGTYWVTPVKVPSTGRRASLRITFHGTAGLTTVPAAGARVTWRRTMLCSSLYASQVTGMPYSEAGLWADVLGPTHEIDITRDELDVSTLTATILDATLDPATADTISAGADVRLRVATERDGLREWEPVYTGRISEGAATYGPSRMEEAQPVSRELVINPTITTTTDTYEDVAAGLTLAATPDGGKITLTGYSTANTYSYGLALKLPVTPGRAYRVKIRARRVSGGHSDGLGLFVRGFDSNDQDFGQDIGYDVVAPGTFTYVTGVGICPAGTGVWQDNEFLIRPEYLAEYGPPTTINLWVNPRGNGTTSPNGEYTITDVSVAEEWTPPALPTKRKSTRITLTAFDAAQKLAQITESRGVANLHEIPALMERSGVPVTVDGVGGLGADPEIVAVNDNATLADQIVAARDTQQGYAHVSRGGVLTLQTPQAVSTLPAATLDEAVYADPDVRYSTSEAISSVIIKWLRFDPTAGESGETIETRYGPYEDLEAIRRGWGRAEEFTWQGLVENPTTIETAAKALLAANSTPTRRIHGLRIPIRYATDLSPSRALLDVMDLVRVKHARTGIDQLLRITEVKHTITARAGRPRWSMSLGFDADGTVARPIPVPSPPVSVSTPQLPHGQALGLTSTTQPLTTATITKVTTAVLTSVETQGGITWQAANNRFVVEKAGIYLLHGRVAWQANATGLRLIYLYKNGAAALLISNPPPSANPFGQALTAPVALAAGDYVELFAYQTSSGNLNLINNAGNCGLSVTYQGA